jgi:hypothetical protein
MRTSVNLAGQVVPKMHESAAGGAATITLAAAENVRHVVDMVWGGYSADPTGGAIQITATVGGTTVTLEVPVTEDVPVVLPFPVPLQGDVNTAVTIVAAAGGGAVVAFINALTR